MRLSLYDHPDGVETGPGNRVVYEIACNEARFGAAGADGHALRWELGDDGEGAILSVKVELDPSVEWIMRCDRVDFAPGAVAPLHTHPGPGIRCLLCGSIRVDAAGQSTEYGPLGAWFERGPVPVFAAASVTEHSAFVRVMLLPSVWRGERTIRYLDPEKAKRPKQQSATVFFDRPISL